MSETPAEDRAYFAGPDDNLVYVCWDCATPEEREDPVPDGDAADEQCARCPTWWAVAE